MSIKVNNINEQKDVLRHYIKDYVAFLDSDGDFYLIDGEMNKIVHICNSGCSVYCTDDCDTIEDFLAINFGIDCKIQKVFVKGKEYEIIINC